MEESRPGRGSDLDSPRSGALRPRVYHSGGGRGAGGKSWVAASPQHSPKHSPKHESASPKNRLAPSSSSAVTLTRRQRKVRG
ncbi:hypothetical protein DIPPA_25286 [Diplonema papillatum]|nr:hypothetical protein DIPPA_25286 [Diplonema papillatum]